MSETPLPIDWPNETEWALHLLATYAKDKCIRDMAASEQQRREEDVPTCDDPTCEWCN